jgi:NitT/TauT family transport system substrate-binding protein
MAEKMRSSVRFVLFVVVFAALALAVKFGSSTKLGQTLKNKASGTAVVGSNTVDELDGKPAITVCVVTWGGYAGGEYFNKGFTAKKASRYWTEYKLPVNFKLIDDFDPSRKAWISDVCQVLWSTADAFPVEASALAEYQPQIIFQSDWSRGGDVIVGTADIHSIKDIRGEKVSFLAGSPSHTFLLKSLEAAGMTQKDIIPVTVPSAPASAATIKRVGRRLPWSGRQMTRMCWRTYRVHTCWRARNRQRTSSLTCSSSRSPSWTSTRKS